MAHPKAAWGMEIGAYAIKAIRLEREGDQVRVSDFAVIPHKKVLTTPDLDQDEMVRLGLGQFISQKALEGEHLVMSVPGHAAFARFAKLPPVEPKKVPDIVKFEAVQQIPFPIDEVEWDYQTFATPDTPEIEVGIFAITRERVQQRLGLYSELGITPESLTLSPIAVFNAMAHDHALGTGSKAIIYVDIGTSATDMIVAEGGRCWIRTFPLGGTHFTEAIANAFKLSYTKAERLKEEAATSKYAKQIMQAMRPVFSDLLQDVQRSIGYYQSLHRESELTTMIGLGSTFKIPGLRKFLGQQLQINVLRLDEYKKIAVTGREAASFAENAVNMATAYGLALQGVGLAAIDANLVPVKALRDQIWHSKTKWFAAAAAIIVAGAGMTLYRPLSDRAALNPGGVKPPVDNAIAMGTKLQAAFRTIESDNQVGALGTNVQRLVEYRDVWPHLVSDAAAALHSANPQPELLGSDAETIRQVDPAQRRFVQMRHLRGDYLPPSDGSANGRRIKVTMAIEFSHGDRTNFLNQTVAQWLRDHAERPGVPYRILDSTDAPISCNPELLQEVRVSATGDETALKGDSDRPSGWTPPEPAMPGAGAGPSGPSAGGGGGSLPGKRQGPAKGIARPGSDIGGAGLSGGGGPAPAMPGKTRPPAESERGGPGLSGPSSPGSTRGDEGSSIKPTELDTKAPVRPPPSVYPPGAAYFRVPITFYVEIIEPKPTTPVPAQAAGPSSANSEESTAS